MLTVSERNNCCTFHAFLNSRLSFQHFKPLSKALCEYSAKQGPAQVFLDLPVDGETRKPTRAYDAKHGCAHIQRHTHLCFVFTDPSDHEFFHELASARISHSLRPYRLAGLFFVVVYRAPCQANSHAPGQDQIVSKLKSTCSRKTTGFWNEDRKAY